MSETPRLKLPLMTGSQAQKHVTHNEAITVLDLLNGVIPVLDRDLSAPPGGDVDGAVYILGAAGTGDWDGFDEHDLALMIDGGWRRVLPSVGMLAAIADEGALLVWFNGSAWTISLAGAGLVTETGAFAVGAGHYGATIRFNSSTNAAVTLPADAPAGTSFSLLQVGVGQALFAPASGASLHHEAAHSRSNAQWAICGAIVESNAGGSAASWVLYGSTQ